MRELTSIGRNLLKVLGFLYLPVTAVLVLLHYPYDTDPSMGRLRSAAVPPAARQFYEAAYQAPAVSGENQPDTPYVELEKLNAEFAGVRPGVESFAQQYHLSDKKVLEIGSGTGSLQDIVPDYTGLDLAASVARYYHKPFVTASATDLPFADDTFDAIWTIWVLEHVPEPERAMVEMRRVLKPGGLLLFQPAWNCPAWLAQGYQVRPYSQFGLGGKLIKASVPWRQSPLFWAAALVPTRLLRLAHYRLAGENTRLHFRALEPNYQHYWMPDSDAAISLDSFEAVKWFESRGDECLNCGSDRDELFDFTKAGVVVRVRKGPGLPDHQAAAVRTRR